jgi:hypothetical protein
MMMPSSGMLQLAPGKRWDRIDNLSELILQSLCFAKSSFRTFARWVLLRNPVHFCTHEFAN